MSRLFIGIDSNGIPALKITRDSADDPYSTPDSQRSKFSYNSNDAGNAAIGAVVTRETGTPGAEYGAPVVYPLSPNTGYLYMSPPGSNGTNYKKATIRVSGGVVGETLYSTRYFDNLRYGCPLLSDCTKNTSNGRYANIRTVAGLSIPGGGYVLTASTGSMPVSPQSAFVVPAGGGYHTLPDNASVTGAERLHWLNYEGGGYILRNVVSKLSRSAAQVLWNLPADNTPLEDAAKIPGTSGVKAITISPTQFKIARQGHNVDTATFDKLVFSADKRPGKVIAAGDVAIAGGTTHVVECGIALNDTVVVEQAMYSGSAISFPFPPSLYIDDTWNFEYKISGSKVVFYNDTATTYHIRYMIIAADDAPPTTGSNKVFRQIDVDGDTVFQILRPGSAEPPALADIVIDSRWPSIPILDEGYLDVLSVYNANPFAGYQSFTVNFANPGNLFPFIKMSVVRGGGASPPYIACSPVVRKRIGPFSPGSEFERLGGDTVYCTLNSNTQAVFHAFRGRIIESGETAFVDDTYPTVGIRYYIFGIPT
ncbi:hypothetical protein PZ897_02015 [Hoeflea sp. YIM 152468]|uniref:hypothetical protein n=1 Tax=Hoeflea sp. YIM 152468 TaxID=3031759 RepID=UPI0023DA1051|nr:hypothetical protein [Hoeflea sp. YIM 152468]MDF1606946.1 hypothetical protein [Hoeflea sp. YIM 152468]